MGWAHCLKMGRGVHAKLVLYPELVQILGSGRCVYRRKIKWDGIQIYIFEDFGQDLAVIFMSLSQCTCLVESGQLLHILGHNVYE